MIRALAIEKQNVAKWQLEAALMMQAPVIEKKTLHHDSYLQR